jgi:hypothetical protein
VCARHSLSSLDQVFSIVAHYDRVIIDSNKGSERESLLRCETTIYVEFLRMDEIVVVQSIEFNGPVVCVQVAGC